MSKKIERVKTTLEIDDDIDLHVRGWILQRVGWILMLAFIIFAGLGFFGEGPMSQESIVNGQTSLNYETYLRRGSNTEIEITTPATSGVVRISLSDAFNKTFRIAKISPEPSDQVMEDGNTLLHFPCSGECRITFFLNVRKEQLGSANNPILVNEKPFTMQSYIYP